MNIPMSWLKDYAAIDVDLKAFFEYITMTGTKVESVTHLGEDISGVVTGRVESIERHPNADKLLITKIDIGERVLQIVTGATNLTVGDYVPVALDGAKLTGGKRIKKGKLRGSESEGMLCDIGELGYTLHDYPEAPEHGIYIFQTPPPLGADVKPILELTDDVVEFEVTSNRPDCNSVLGVAREVAATYGQTLVVPAINVKETAGGNASDMIAVEIKNTELCPRYIARVVKNVRIEPSPQWLRHRLTASGVRPINNIVDITNYVMLEYGQPMHAFDIDNIAGRKIIVRNAEPGEVFTTLDGVSRQLDESMLVIADCDKAVAIAGVMGGENSMVTGEASAILFESANFNGTNVRLTSKKLGLRTEASARFEKGLDPHLALKAVNRAMQLIEELHCGEVVRGMADAFPNPPEERTVAFDPARINALLGIEISGDAMGEYLSRLGIKAENNAAIIPTSRADIACEADIAEEIARFYGYNNIPSAELQKSAQPGGKNEHQKLKDRISRLMTALGYSEAMTYPFESPKVFDKLRIPADSELRNAIRIQNPLGEDFSVMRTTTLDGLLQSLSINFNRRNDAARLFEIAKVYRPQSLPLTEQPHERNRLTLVAYDRNGMDYFDLKGDVEQLLTSLGCDTLRFETCAPTHMHPGRTASVHVCTSVRGQKDTIIQLGYLGELHPELCENYQIGTRVYAAVLDMDAIAAHVIGKPLAFKPLPKYPAVQRDLALRVQSGASAADIEAAIRERAGSILTQVLLFDVYQGKQIEEGYKSMAYKLFFRASDRTLTDEEVSKQVNAILTNLEQKLGVSLRDK